jgi:hypothetical protein
MPLTDEDRTSGYEHADSRNCPASPVGPPQQLIREPTGRIRSCASPGSLGISNSLGPVPPVVTGQLDPNWVPFRAGTSEAPEEPLGGPGPGRGDQASQRPLASSTASWTSVTGPTAGCRAARRCQQEESSPAPSTALAITYETDIVKACRMPQDASERLLHTHKSTQQSTSTLIGGHIRSCLKQVLERFISTTRSKRRWAAARL